MSHVATISTVILDLDALAAAAEKCGCKFVWGQTTHRWYGRWMNDYSNADAAYLHGIDPKMYGKCEHAITLPGNSSAYEVGIVKNPNGPGYLLLYDFWQGGYGMSAHIGTEPPMGKLLAQYARAVELKQAQAQGYGVTETVDQNGDIVMECEDYSYVQQS